MSGFDYDVADYLRDYDEEQPNGSCAECGGDLYEDDLCERSGERICGECAEWGREKWS